MTTTTIMIECRFKEIREKLTELYKMLKDFPVGTVSLIIDAQGRQEKAD